MLNTDPEPKILRVEQIVNDVVNGTVRLPRFQRPFVWSSQDITKLFDSIYRGYPIGSVLFWSTRAKLASERIIGDIEISNNEDREIVTYILDGQQRISSLCGALFSNRSIINSQWNVCFDLQNNKFIIPTEKDDTKYLFPLRKLLKTGDFLRECTRLNELENPDKLIEKAENLLQKIKDYKIAAVYLGDMTIDEVAPIFERINSSGRLLTIVDLMKAATWKNDFDLNELIEDIKLVCEENGFYDVNETHILRNIAAGLKLGINKEDIEKIATFSSDIIRDAAHECKEAYSKAIHFLKEDIGLVTKTFLPYNLQLTYLTEYFRNSTLDQIKLLKCWFWLTSLSGRYGGANSTLINNDIKKIRKLAKDPDNRSIFSDLRCDDVNFETILGSNFGLNKASSKTMLILLSNNNPKDIYTQEALNIESIQMEGNKKRIEFIFPKSFFKDNDNENDYSIIANMILVNPFTNTKIKRTDLFSYLKTENISEEVLESLFLDKEMVTAIQVEDFNTFIELRKKRFINEIKMMLESC